MPHEFGHHFGDLPHQASGLGQGRKLFLRALDGHGSHIARSLRFDIAQGQI
jgi:hypothetical protein